MFGIFKSDPRREARRALKQGDYRTAGDRFKLLGDLENALQAYLKGGLYSEAAALYEELGDWPNAARYWERARRFREAGEAYIRAEKLEDAIRMFRQEGDFGRAKELALRLQRWEVAADCAERIRQYSEAARYYYKAGLWMKAAEMAEKALEILEKDRAERQHLPEWRKEFIYLSKMGGAAYFKAGDYLRAGDLLAQAEDFDNALESYLRAGNPEKALLIAVKKGDYQKGYDLMQKYPETRSNLELCATVYYHLGQYKEAAKLYLAAQKPLDAARAFEKLGNFNEAAFLYEQAMEYENAADLYIKAENWSKAAELFRKIGNHSQAGVYFEKAGKLEEAIEEYTMAQQFTAAGRILYEQKKLEDAIKALQRVDIFSPDYEEASILLATIMIEMERPEVALKRLDDLINELNLDVVGPDIHYLRGRALEALGQFDEAVEAYREVLALDVGYKDAGERLNHCERLKQAKVLNGARTRLIAGRFNVLETLSDHPSTKLYRAVDVRNNQPVLLQVIKTDDPITFNDLNIPKGFNHPNVLIPTEIFSRESTVYILMEYYEGQTLSQWLQQSYSIPEVRSITMQIAEALYECHQKGLYFGCLPPDWIQITKDKKVKIFPWFALTRRHLPEILVYAAPEYRNQKVVGPASDVFVFGVLLHVMLTRKPPIFPFKAKSLGDIPEPLKQTLERSLVAEPSGRLEDMRKVIEHLAMSDVYAGALIDDRYEIIKELGRGGMGRVFLAYDKVLGENIAMKILNTDVILHPDAAQRLVQEIKIARKITHPNVVKVYEIRVGKGAHYITMEYVNGVPIHKVVRNTGPFPLKIWWKMAQQIVSGLNAAHQLGIVHRDLKPQNILMTREGVIKILDFGIARAVDASGDQTQTGSIFGSPKYMSPEQIEGKPVDPRSDLYSLGVIFYFMLTGREPFTGDTVKAILAKHLFEAPQPPNMFRRDLPEPVNRMILKLLEKKPEKRFQSCADVATALNAIHPFIFKETQNTT